MIYILDIIFKWRDLGLGDTWALLKTQNLKKAFIIPKEAEHLKFILETFFWDRITFELKPYSYFINKRLGIVYRNEGGNIILGSNTQKDFCLSHNGLLLSIPRLHFKALKAISSI